MLVAHDLDFDMPGALDELFDEDPVVAERALGLAAHRGKALLHVAAVPGDTDALPTPSGGGLQHHRIADLLGDRDRVVEPIDLAHVAGHHRDPGLDRALLRSDLVAHGIDSGRIGADEGHTGFSALPREFSLFGEKAEAGVDCLRACRNAGGDDLVRHEIRLRGGRRTYGHRLVSHLHRQAIGVGLRIDHHRTNPETAAGLDDADGDLTAVGD